MAATTFSTTHGYQIRFTVEDYTDVLIVPSIYVETEDEAIQTAILAARHGYPTGAINITSIQLGRWCPTGFWANPEHTAIYANGY